MIEPACSFMNLPHPLLWRLAHLLRFTDLPCLETWEIPGVYMKQIVVPVSRQLTRIFHGVSAARGAQEGVDKRRAQ